MVQKLNVHKTLHWAWGVEALITSPLPLTLEPSAHDDHLFYFFTAPPLGTGVIKRGLDLFDYTGVVKLTFINDCSHTLFPQIVEAMKPMFKLMSDAVSGIRDKVQEAFSQGQTFTRKDTDAKQYEICCTHPDLKDHPDFPNVSATI